MLGNNRRVDRSGIIQTIVLWNLCHSSTYGSLHPTRSKAKPSSSFLLLRAMGLLRDANETSSEFRDSWGIFHRIYSQNSLTNAFLRHFRMAASRFRISSIRLVAVWVSELQMAAIAELPER